MVKDSWKKKQFVEMTECIFRKKNKQTRNYWRSPIKTKRTENHRSQGHKQYLEDSDYGENAVSKV